VKKVVLLFISLSALLFAQQPDTIISIIDPGNRPGTDFTSLQAWADARAGDLTLRNTIEVAKCRCTNGKADTAANISKFITDSTHYIKIYTDTTEGFRHQGIYPSDSSNVYRIEDSLNYSSLLQVITSKVIIDGICFKVIKGNGNAITLTDCRCGGYVEGCLIERNKDSLDEHGHGIRIDAATKPAEYYIRNNIIYGFKNDSLYTAPNCGILTYPTGDSLRAFIDNNTIYYCKYGIWNRNYNPSIVTARNNLIQNCIGGNFYVTEQYTKNSTNNISSDTTAPAFGKYWRNTIVAFMDTANRDFHLIKSSVPATGNGIDLSHDLFDPFNTDVDGEIRIKPWDIGADNLNDTSKITGVNNIITLNSDNQDPKSFSLSNYPNPFNPATTISYKINSGGRIKLIIYDILGKEIQRLVDEWQSAGVHTVSFDGSKLPSGVYVYELLSSNFIACKKMMLVK